MSSNHEIDPWVPAAQAAIDAHNTAARLETGHPADTDVFQFLASLMVYCEHRGLDFDDLVEYARSEFGLA